MKCKLPLLKNISMGSWLRFVETLDSIEFGTRSSGVGSTVDFSISTGAKCFQKVKSVIDNTTAEVGHQVRLSNATHSEDG